MSAEMVAQIQLRDCNRLNGSLLDDMVLRDQASQGELRFLKSDTSGITFTFVLPANWTYTTGLTFYFNTTDDGSDSNDLGLVAVFGITVKKLNTGTATPDITTGAGTETTGTVTMASTTQYLVNTSIAVTNANLNSAGAGDTVLVRLRRIGTNASDTLYGPVMLSNIYVKNT